MFLAHRNHSTTLDFHLKTRLDLIADPPIRNKEQCDEHGSNTRQYFAIYIGILVPLPMEAFYLVQLYVTELLEHFWSKNRRLVLKMQSPKAEFEDLLKKKIQKLSLKTYIINYYYFS